MSVRLIPASEVSAPIHAAVDGLLERHRVDLPGLLSSDWGKCPVAPTFVVLDGAGEPVGIVSWTGPANAADPSWWTRPDRRGQGCAKRAVELMAEEMRSSGVERIKDGVLIQVPGDDPGLREASRRLIVLLRRLVDRH